MEYVQNNLQTHLYSVQLGIWATTPDNPDGDFFRVYATTEGIMLKDESGNVFKVLSTGDNTITLEGVAVAKVGTDVELSVGGDDGRYRSITFYTDALARWAIHTNDAAESGSNAGSNYQINRHADDGSYLGTAMVIFRSNGNVLFEGSLEIDGSINHDGTQIGFNGNAPVTRQTYGAPTGTISRSALTDSSTTTDVRNVLKALITDLRSRGDLG